MAKKILHFFHEQEEAYGMVPLKRLKICYLKILVVLHGRMCLWFGQVEIRMLGL